MALLKRRVKFWKRRWNSKRLKQRYHRIYGIYLKWRCDVIFLMTGYYSWRNLRCRESQQAPIWYIICTKPWFVYCWSLMFILNWSLMEGQSSRHFNGHSWHFLPAIITTIIHYYSYFHIFPVIRIQHGKYATGLAYGHYPKWLASSGWPSLLCNTLLGLLTI